MFYNSNKLKIVEFGMGQKFGQILKRTNYKFVYNSIVGALVAIDFWLEEKRVLELTDGLSAEEEALIKYFVLCYPIKEEMMLTLLGDEGVDFLVKSGLATKRGVELCPNGYAILPVNNLLLILSLPQFYTQSKSKFTDIYIGQDSARLSQMVAHINYQSILDLCAGSGIQGMNLTDCSKNIDAVEMNDTAYIAARLNQMINDIPESVYNVYQGDLYEAVPNKRYDCIISNPPYVPCPDDIELPMCGAGGEDGMEIARRIIDGYEDYLNENGRAYMVLECIGDEKKPYIIDYLMEKTHKGVINVSLINRQSIEFQAAASAKLTTNFYDNPTDYCMYQKKWNDMFKRHNAKYIYPVVFEYINTDCPLKMNIVHNYVKWNAQSKYSIKAYQGIEMEQVNYCKIETEQEAYKYVKSDFWEELLVNQGKTIYEMVENATHDEETFCKVLDQYIKQFIILDEQQIVERR